VSRLCGSPKIAARARARELLRRFKLDDAADRPAKGYSGGMRRRLDLAGAEALIEALRLLDAQNVTVRDVGLHRPTLDDVFLSLTGHGAETSPTPVVAK
jgi:ABC-type taurine transport system ATPase subunit